MSIALTVSFSAMAQDTVKKDKDNKEKTECTKTCSKDNKEKCNKSEAKACCSKKESCSKKEANADKKAACCKEKKS